MGYQFSMEKKSAALLVTGFVLVGALLFSAGLLMGVHFGLGSALISANPQQPPGNPAEPAAPTTIAEQTISRASANRESAVRTTPVTSTADNTRDQQDSSIAREESPDGIAEPEQDEGRLKDPLFWVQVGVFRSELEAERMIDDLEGRGYEPAIYEGIDTDQRLYFAVRIGSYYDRDEASQSAADFEKRENKRAIVRTISAL